MSNSKTIGVKRKHRKAEKKAKQRRKDSMAKAKKK